MCINSGGIEVGWRNGGSGSTTIDNSVVLLLLIVVDYDLRPLTYQFNFLFQINVYTCGDLINISYIEHKLRTQPSLRIKIDTLDI